MLARPIFHALTAASLLAAATPAATARADVDPRAHEVVHPLSAGHLLVVLDEDHVPGGAVEDWTVASEDDPGYAGGVHPDEVATAARAAALVPEGWPYPAVLEHLAVLALPSPLQAGATYQVEGAGGSWEVPFDPELDWSPSIKVNQVGYLSTAAERHAYVGHWLVDLPPLELDGEEAAFRVVDADGGETVLDGSLTLRLAWDQGTEDQYDSNYSLANLYEADLSPLAAPGRYYLVWEGVGRSWPFRVGGDVYDEPFVTAFRALLHQRCGAELAAEHTDWPHGTCHTDPVELTDADYQEVGADAFGALPAAATGVLVKATGGYHDAGDYDRRIEHLAVVDVLVDLIELAPERHTGDDLGIPESGNGLPDVLDEALWAIDLYAQLQEEDGGVPAGVETTGYPDWGTMPEDDPYTEWYAYAADPVSSYRFAGAAAKLSRALAGWDGGAAADWLERAERAWAWAEAQGDPGYDTDAEGAYAAAELFKTTGEPDYDTAFQQQGVFASGLGYSPDDWDTVDVRPLWAYATAAGADPAYQAAAADLLVDWADRLLVFAEGTGYRRVKQSYTPICYGSGTTPRTADLLIAAHQLTGDDRYREWLAATADTTLGANEAGLSYVTGLGSRPVVQPLHNPSMADGIDAPVPGLTVFGPAHYSEDDGILGAAIDAYDPEIGRWPIGERFVDVAYVPEYDEFTVHGSIAPTVLAFGYLAELAGTPGDDDDDDSADDDDDGDDDDSGDGPGDDCSCRLAGGGGGALPALLALALLLATRRPRGRG